MKREWVIPLLVSFLLTGCIFGKSKSAVEEMSVVSRFASTLEAASSLSRSSGQATFTRLTTLFPTSTQPSVALLSESQFNILKAQGSDRSLALFERPTSALAQVSLREKAGHLCKALILDSNEDQSTVFATANLGIAKLPTLEPMRMALAAARNVWLDLYTESSPEVQELASLYRVVSLSTGSVLQAKRAVCMAAVLAPQFWLGNPTATDPLRRAVLELGRRVPTFQELQDFADGKKTLGEFVQMLQAESGYLKAVHDWHEEWLGLRPVAAGMNGDLRSNDQNGGLFGANTLAGFGFDYDAPSGILTPQRQAYGRAQSCANFDQAFDPRTTQIVWEHQDVLEPGLAGTELGWYIAAAFVHEDGVAAFKQRLAELYLNPMSSSHPGYDSWRNSVVQGISNQYGGSADALFNELCARMNLLDPANTWYRCRGIVLLRPEALAQIDSARNVTITPEAYGAFVPPPRGGPLQSYDDIRRASIREDSGDTWSGLLNLDNSGNTNFYYALSLYYMHDWRFKKDASGHALFLWSEPAYLHTQPAGVTYYNYGTLYPYLGVGMFSTPISINSQNLQTPLVRRVRRFSVSGEQNGMSTVSLWYSGQSARICNNMDRFWATCSYRPGTPGQANRGLTPYSTPDDIAPMVEFRGSWMDSIGNPTILDNMQCGVPVVSQMPANVTAANRTQGFPKGYSLSFDGATYHYGALQSLQNLAVNITASTAPAEAAKISGIHQEMQNEPYQLLNHILNNNLDYRDMIRGKYTCISNDLLTLYRTQNYYLPVAPNQIASGFLEQNTGPNDSCGPGLRLVYQGTGNSGASLPLALLENPYGTSQGGILENVFDNGVTPAITANAYFSNHGYVIPERSMSGILTMPALLGPVSPKMRTIAARYFTRLMCGEANLYVPTAQTLPLHAQYVNQPTHLQPACISCHINMDPLASALSGNFRLKLGTINSESVGEMFPTFLSTEGTGVIGFRGGGPKGEGALLGTKVTGVQEVGEVLASSKEFGRCTVQKAFENLFGHSPQFTDADFMKRMTTYFMEDPRDKYKYNRLIQTMVESPEFSRRN